VLFKLSGIESSSIEPPLSSIFEINEYLTLKLEEGKTNIYVAGELFRQCKFLFINIPVDAIGEYDEIDSIDEAAEKLDNKMECKRDEVNVASEDEFWGHCSNLQVFYEHDYDTRMLHRNLAFPLLRKLTNAGDPIAKRAFKNEVAKRVGAGNLTVFLYLLVGEYLKDFTLEERKTFLDNPKVMECIHEALVSINPGIRKKVIHFLWRIGKEGAILLKNLFPKVLPSLGLVDFRDLTTIFYHKFGQNKQNVKDIIKIDDNLIQFLAEKLFVITTQPDFNEEGYKRYVYTLINYFEYTQDTEIRHIDNLCFLSRLHTFYEEQDCKLFFDKDGYDYISDFRITIPGKHYYLEKEMEDYTNYECLRTIKSIFFPQEYIVITGIQKWYMESEPHRLICTSFKNETEAINFFEGTIVPVLSSSKSGYKLLILEVIGLIGASELSIQSKLITLYLTGSYIIDHLIQMEVVFIDYTVFHTTLTEYYNKQNCDIEFELMEGDWICKYKVKPRGEVYFYDMACEEENRKEQIGAFRELEKVFFSSEDVEIIEVQQRYSDDAPYRIYIKRPREGVVPAELEGDLYR